MIDPLDAIADAHLDAQEHARSIGHRTYWLDRREYWSCCGEFVRWDHGYEPCGCADEARAKLINLFLDEDEPGDEVDPSEGIPW